MASPQRSEPQSAQTFVERHSALIARITGIVCSRHLCFGADADDFRQEVYVRLLEGRAIASYRGDCSVETFLSVVITNLYRDFRISQWGKWRPSARAVALGTLATRLETLTVRDGLLLEEAVEVVVADPAVSESPDELRELAQELPPRVLRSWVDEKHLNDKPSPSLADQNVQERERASRRARIRAALTSGVAALTAEEQLLVKLRFEEGTPVSQLARAWQLPPRQLYGRFEKINRALKRAMIDAGISTSDIRDVLGDFGSD